MKVIKYEDKYFNDVTNLLANFRVTLRSFKGENTSPDVEDAKDELKQYLDEKFPLFIAINNDKAVGYVLLRVQGVVWVEHIFVSEEYRKKGIGSMLYEKAEEYSTNLGGDTMFNYVHPNNDRMINFLKSKGYSVLNLIEIRKPFKGEKTKTKIEIGNNKFDY